MYIFKKTKYIISIIQFYRISINNINNYNDKLIDIIKVLLVIDENNTTKIQNEDKLLPGSSQPQDLGSISYKDTETGQKNQEIQD